MVEDSHRAAEVIRGIRGLVRKDTSVQSRLNLNSVIEDTVRLVSTDVVAHDSIVETDLIPLSPR